MVASCGNLSGTAGAMYVHSSQGKKTLGRFFCPEMEEMMEASITALDYKIRLMAGRIKELREIEGLTTYEMASKTQISRDEYF